MIAPPLVIRPATAADLPAVLQIERDCFADPWSAESFRNSLAPDRMRFLVAEAVDLVDDGKALVLGYVIALMLSDEAEIADIAVSADARRRGIGALLLDAAVEALAQRGIGTLFLEVRESNVAARALYESRSFVEVGRRRGYYRHPLEDAVVLRREIAPV